MQDTPRSPPTSTLRWVLCGMLFFATTVNYIDRQILGLLKPTLAAEFGWRDSDYADILIAFQIAYAVGLLGFGWLIDRIGSRMGLALAVGGWSVFAALHGAASAKIHFIAVRAGLGVSESGCFPAAVKVVAEQFPPQQKALATGILNAGTSVGAIATPLIVPYIALTYGWRAAFIATGVIGVIWIGAWFAVTRGLAPAAAGAGESKPSWITLLRRPEVMGFTVAKFLTDPVWSLFLNWLPDFFARTYRLDLRTFGPSLIAVYLMADVGSVGGGWLSSTLIARGVPVFAARRWTMLVCVVCVAPLVATVGSGSLVVAVIAIGLAAAAHQGWSSNLFTLVADAFPGRMSASVVGLGACIGTCGSILMSRMAGWTLDATGSYVPMFVYAGLAYPIALSVLELTMFRRGLKGRIANLAS